MKKYFYWVIYLTLLLLKHCVFISKKEKFKKNYFFNLLSSSSTEHVNLHFGKPLQPINSP